MFLNFEVLMCLSIGIFLSAIVLIQKLFMKSKVKTKSFYICLKNFTIFRPHPEGANQMGSRPPV